MADTGELEVDTLFLGLTRPPMLFGVSYTVVLAYFFTSMLYFVATSDFRCVVIAAVCHVLGVVASQKEPLFLELFMIKQQRCNRCSNKLYHGMANSYDVT